MAEPKKEKAVSKKEVIKITKEGIAWTQENYLKERWDILKPIYKKYFKDYEEFKQTILKEVEKWNIKIWIKDKEKN